MFGPSLKPEDLFDRKYQMKTMWDYWKGLEEDARNNLKNLHKISIDKLTRELSKTKKEWDRIEANKNKHYFKDLQMLL